MRKLRDGPLDGKEVKDHVKYDPIYFEQPWHSSPIWVTAGFGRAIYLRDGENYRFNGYVEEWPEEILEK